MFYDQLFRFIDIGFVVYLAKKYSNLFLSQTDILVTTETKYRDIYQHMGVFLNDLYEGTSSCLITSEQEKECLKQALGHMRSFYQITSDKFIHEASKQSIAESILLSDTTNKEIWMNMYKIVYNEEPDLYDTLPNTTSIL